MGELRQHGSGRGLALCAAVLFAPACAAQVAEPRPWNLNLRLFASHDSNVPLAATETNFSGNKATDVFGLTVNGDHRLYRAEQWTVAATGAFTQTRNRDPALREFDLTSVAPGVLARHGFRLGSHPSTLSMAYAARRDWLGGSGYATGHTASLDLGVRPARGMEVGVFGTAAYSDFDDDGSDPGITSRDAMSYRGGLRGTLTFNRYQQALQGSISYVKNDAEGADFVFRGPAANLQVMSFIWGPWAAAASVGYARIGYTNFTAEPRRETTVKDYRLTVFGPVTRKVSVDLSYGRSRFQSNQSAFEARRQNISLGLAYSF